MRGYIRAPTQRLFFALWPSEEVRSGLVEVMASLHARRAKPVAAENLHITLLFLGSVTAQTRICAEKIAEEIAGHSFELRLDQIGFWPKSGILWLGAREVPESLAALVRDLHLGIAGCGIDLDARPFKPHVTLMRKALVVRRDRSLPSPGASMTLAWSSPKPIPTARVIKCLRVGGSAPIHAERKRALEDRPHRPASAKPGAMW